jgi:hypothetical protein
MLGEKIEQSRHRSVGLPLCVPREGGPHRLQRKNLPAGRDNITK